MILWARKNVKLLYNNEITWEGKSKNLKKSKETAILPQ